MTAGSQAVFERYRGHEDDPDAQDRLWQELAHGLLQDPEVPWPEHWRLYESVFADRDATAGPPQAWRPDDARIQGSNLAWLMGRTGNEDLPGLHAWSAAHRADYWQAVLDRLQVPFHEPPAPILDDADGVEDARWLPGARLNVAELCFQADPGAPAILAGREGSDTVTTWTFGELKRLADRVGHGLQGLGLQPGDAVALYLPMTPECVAAYLGIVQAGMAVVSIPDSFAAPEVATRLRLGDAKAVVSVDAFQRGGRSIPMAPKAREAAAGLEGDVTVIVIGDDAGDGLPWDDFLGPDQPFDAVPCDPDDVTNVLFSSGTTGEPKAIPWTHGAPIKSAADGHFHQDIHPGDVVAWPTNIGWMMGPWLIYASLGNRATMALYEGVPTGQGFLDFCNRTGVTMLGLVPAIVRAWREVGVPPHSLPGVQVFSSTGEASNPQDFLYLMSLASYRAPIIEYCGGTEVGGGHLTGTVVQPASPATFTTPALGLDFVILDEDGRPVGEGEHGEIHLVPPSLGLSQRLLNRDHHATYYAGCPPGPDGQVLRRHGDEVEHLAGWWWRAQGRADDTMNLGGIKVGSVELETVMNTHPAVRETAAVAVPPEGGGAERLVVYAVLADGAGDVEEGALKTGLQQRIKERLNPLFRIHDLVVTDDLPRTASNKVMRRKLRDAYEA